MRVPPSAVYRDRAALESAFADQRPWLQQRACAERPSTPLAFQDLAPGAVQR
jgi:hypothetical protein